MRSTTDETSDVPAVTAALDALLARDYSHRPQARAKLRRTVLQILDAIRDGRDLETYAVIDFGFWYKVYFFTRSGALKSDTNGVTWWQSVYARRVVTHLTIARVPLSAVLENWAAADLWGDQRPVDALLLQTWRAYRTAYYATQRSSA